MVAGFPRTAAVLGESGGALRTRCRRVAAILDALVACRWRTLTPVLSVMFLMMYAVIFAYIVQREREVDHTFMQSGEVMEAVTAPDGERDIPKTVPVPVRRFARHDWFWPLMLLIAVGGIVVGAEGSASGVEGILDTWELSGTFVGVTFITILYTIDDILLVIEPLRLGYPDVAVGGVIGSLLFFVTANVGIIGF